MAEDTVAESDEPAPAPPQERTIDPDSLIVVLARPFPAGWPAPHMPFGRVESELPRLAPAQLAQLQKSERRREEEPTKAMPKPPAPNRRSKLCRCGKHDEAKFMLGCDGCDRWFHGACVGVTEEAAKAAGGELQTWYCRPCTRRQEAEADRRRRYCICRGVWDGRAFMIACDTCGAWYHGACVGFSPRTVHESTQAAFKKYCCPACAAPPPAVAAAAAAAAATAAAAAAAAATTPSRRTMTAAAKRNGKAAAESPEAFAVGRCGEEAEAEVDADAPHGKEPWLRAAALGLRQRTPPAGTVYVLRRLDGSERAPDPVALVPFGGGGGACGSDGGAVTPSGSGSGRAVWRGGAAPGPSSAPPPYHHATCAPSPAAAGAAAARLGALARAASGG